ncbi:hydroxysqualene dehydroxylase HpnE [Undibacterium danionis]|uniref:Hydroxysqualene dehydroxylase HpnE n=1 Tax=Undibacterium danionis TaxID=1812100 RepID=A0ABV6IG87_9BURK
MIKLRKGSTPKRVAVIGAGWAGCAAAVKLCQQQGHQVTLIEAAKRLGGRARAVEINGQQLDNGQHIMLGAYTACLDLMRLLKIDLKSALLRLPLQMVYPQQTGMQFIAPKFPAPLHLLFALINAKGLDRADKMALARFSTTARWIDWRLHQDCSVSELLERYEQTERLCRLMWTPLCIAALNTPPERASAQVFLNVLRDSLGAQRAASDMLIPRIDLSRLLPDAAADYLQQHNGQVLTGLRIKTLRSSAHGTWILDECPGTEKEFDSIVIATNATQCQRLLADIGNAYSNDSEAPSFPEFSYEAITTCYLQYAPEVRLERAFFALADNPTIAHWGQFVFDRGQLDVTQSGLLAVVVSASNEANQNDHSTLTQAIAKQLAEQLQMPELMTPKWTQIITEKRATFACTPNLDRPENRTVFPGVFIAGDYTAGEYPATLEAAVRSGILAAQIIDQRN